MYVRHQLGRLCLGLCLLALASVQVVHAQSTDRISAAEFGRLWGPALDPAGATQVRNYPVGPAYPVTSTPSITAEAGGGLAVSKSARFPVDPSRVIDVTAKAPISKAAMGKAFKLAVGLSGGPLGLALFAASEISDWMNQAQLRRNETTGNFEKQDPNVCTVAPCYAFSTRSPQSISAYTPYLGSRKLACERARDLYASWAGKPYTIVNDNYNPQYGMGSCYVSWVNLGTTYYLELPYFYQSASPSAPQWVVATPAEIETAASTPTMKPEWLTRILDSGVSVDAGLPSLTGPSSVAGPSSSSTKQLKDSTGNVTGNQTVNQSTVYNITYNGNTYNVNSVTTTTTVNPDGTSTVQTDTASKPAEKDQATDCDKFPSSVGCTDLGNPTSDVLNKKTQAVTVVAATFASSSGCPAPLTFTVATRPYSFSYQPLCDRLALLKVLFLAIAGVLAAYILADSFRVQ